MALTSGKYDFPARQVLLDIYARLTDAGRRNDLVAAEAIIDESVKAGIKPTDILFGIIAPMLYQAGEDWERGTFTVTEEHRLTAFCEAVVALISERVGFVTQSPIPQPDRTEVLLMNACGNIHTIALRILGVKLMSEGIPALTVEMPSSPEGLTALLTHTRPKCILISMALADQSKDVTAFAKRVSEIPETSRPRIIVGGYAVKSGLVTEIPGADLIADICSLERIPV
jgi:methanogenic corrinoid protein MtbC1